MTMSRQLPSASSQFRYLTASAYQRDRRGAVMGSAKGASCPIPRVEGSRRHGEHGGRFQRFRFAHCGQEPLKTLREHRLPGARRADHEEMVATARRDLEGTSGAMLAPNLIQVARLLRREVLPRRYMCGKRRAFSQVPVHVEQAPCGKDAHPVHQTRRDFVAHGQNQGASPSRACRALGSVPPPGRSAPVSASSPIIS